MNYTEILLKKLDSFLSNTEDNDFHNIISCMVTNALMGRILNYKLHTEKINAYFNYSPEVFEIIKKYHPSKLMKFLDKIIKTTLITK